MKIAILAAGAGGMYCGSCLRDNALAGALKRLGHQVTLVPLFSPVRTDIENQSGRTGVFFGGINIYLQHASRLFRKTPRAVDWLLDRQWLLNVATNYGSSTPPEQLVDLTLDLLKGDAGNAAKEVRRLANFIRDDLKPDIVTLPNLMFLGVAPAFRELKIPVICELTGEDVFLDALGEQGGAQVREAICRNVPFVDRFVATSKAYADRMATYLGFSPSPGTPGEGRGGGRSILNFKFQISDSNSPHPVRLRSRQANPPPEYRERGKEIAVVYPGLPKEFLDALPPIRRKSSGPPTVGYFARICPEKGFDHFIDAMILLRQRPEFANLQVRAAGYLGKKDTPFFEKIKQKIDASPLRDSFMFLGEVDQAAKIDLLQSVHVFSVPAFYPEAKGIYLLEAMASGLPAVQPATGSYPELIERTGGGIITEPKVDALATGLAELLTNQDRREKYAQAGRQAVRNEFTDERMARDMLTIFEEICQ